MATLLELYNLRYATATLKAKVTAAIAIAAQVVMNEAANVPNHAQRLIWARNALQDTQAAAERMMWGVLSDATVQANGENATDPQIQAAVNNAINTFSN